MTLSSSFLDDEAGGSGDVVEDIDITGCHPQNHDYLEFCIEGDEIGVGTNKYR